MTDMRHKGLGREALSGKRKAGAGAVAARWAAVVVLAACLAAPAAPAQPLTVYQIQYTENADGSSNYHNQVVDCLGGIVVAKYPGYRPRLVLADPDPGHYPPGWTPADGWSAIQVKDWIYPFEMYEEAEVGDWISFTNMLVEDFRGTTLLQRQSAYNPTYLIESSMNPLPPPIIVPIADIPAPLEYPGNEWYVEDHGAERYESMRLVVRDVTVSAWNLGKAVDNYDLAAPGGASTWATDYMNVDALDVYHPFVQLGRHFCAVGGILEQYTRLENGWDYYQLLTQSTIDLAICGDGDSDGDVTAADWPRCEECLVGPQCDGASGGCNPPAWTWNPPALDVQYCLMADLDYDGDADLADFASLQIMSAGS